MRSNFQNLIFRLKQSQKNTFSQTTVLGHILCLHPTCISDEAGIYCIGYDAGGKEGAVLRELDSVEMPNATALSHGFEQAFSEAKKNQVNQNQILTPISTSNLQTTPIPNNSKSTNLPANTPISKKTQKPKRIRKGGTRSDHTKKHLNLSDNNRKPTSKITTPDPSGSHFTRNASITPDIRTNMGFRQVLMLQCVWKKKRSKLKHVFNQPPSGVIKNRFLKSRI